MQWIDHMFCEMIHFSCLSDFQLSVLLTADKCSLSWASLVAQMVKNLPAMQETWVRFLGWEDPSEKGMATHSSILAWRIPWTEKPGGLQSMGLQRVRHDWVTKHSSLCLYILLSRNRLRLGRWGRHYLVKIISKYFNLRTAFFFFFGHITWHVILDSQPGDDALCTGSMQS